MLPAPGQEKCTEVDGNGNCLPGTVVEQGVVNPCLFDFYLLAHVSTVGTSRPAYYMVLHDDNKFSVEDIQRLTYNLSYMYPIVPKAATMPAPIYYAHRLTGQGRFHTSIPFDQLPKFTGKRANDISLVSVHRNLESGMYFM
ncbi:hypothetical protein FBU59_006998 [Linderina macrospora]|uniref:Uncharacterized protein n=1 Tax=Linderina macrospora TaxID=4868 RepID=A0ACC1IY87_9FUNG|nr:hypothetical protein FBU59_006998 [Linderina macrospora]